METIAPVETAVKTVTVANNVTVKEMITLILDTVEQHGFIAVTLNSSEHLRVFAEAFNVVEKRTHYRHSVALVAGLVITIVYGKELWADKGALAFVKDEVTASVLRNFGQARARAKEATAAN